MSTTTSSSESSLATVPLGLGIGAAVVDPLARVLGQVQFGARAKVGSGAVIEGPFTAGDDLYVHPRALLGGPAQHRRADRDGTLQLGHRVEVREAATIHRGTRASAGVTRLADDVLVMAYAHVGHDCSLGDRVTLCNGAQLGGHVDVAAMAMIGARAALHQFVRVGEGAMIAAGSMVAGDVPPWTLVAGDRARIIGANTQGLKQYGYGDSLSRLRRAMRLLWPPRPQAGIKVEQLIAALGDEAAHNDPVIASLLRFLRQPSRRSCCPRGRR